MAGQADGSIIIDTELNSDGFKAGSAELLAAIKSLSNEVKTLGQTLKDTFSGNDKGVGQTDSRVQALEDTISSLQAEAQSMKATITELQEKLDSLNDGQSAATPIDFNVEAAEAKIATLEEKVKELETTIAQLQSGDGGAATQTINFGGTSGKASSLQNQIDAVNSSVEKLEPTFQRALGGSESAMTSFEAKAATLENKIADLQAKLTAAGQVKMPTAEYQSVSAEVTKTAQKFDALLSRQEKMQAMGVKENSKQWKSLQYDMEVVSQKYHELLALKQQLEASGGAYVMGSTTAEYAQMEASLAAANQRLAEMRSGLNQSGGLMSRVASGARSVFMWIGRAAGTLAGKFVSAIKSAASHLVKMVTHGKSMKNQFGKLISSAKMFTMSLLGARSIYMLLRKAVSAYMQENQQLSAQLSACWSSIGNILGPIITRLITLVSTAVAYITQFLALLGFVGKSTTKAISSAGGAAKEETKELKRSLASFDELNILNDKDSEANSGGGTSDLTGEMPEVTIPDWVQTMIDHLKSGEWSKAATVLTDQLNSMIDSVDWAGIGSKMGYWINGALEFLATAITNFDWYSLGANLGDMINNMVYGVDWSNLGIVLGWKLIACIEGLGGLFATIDWEALGRALSSAFMGLWNAIDWKQAAKTLSDGIVGVLNGLSEAIETVNWRKLGNDIAMFIANIDYSGVFSALSRGIGAALGGLGSFIIGLVEDAWNSVVDWWYDVAYEDGEFTMEGLLKGIWDAICDVYDWIVEHIFNPFIDGFKSAFGIHSPSTVMKEQGGYIVDGLLLGLENAWTELSTWISTAFTDLLAIVTAWATNAGFNISTWAANAGISIQSWATNAGASIRDWASGAMADFKSWATDTKSQVSKWSSNVSSSISTWASNAETAFRNWTDNTSEKVSSWVDTTRSNVSEWAEITKERISTWADTTKTDVTSWVASTKSSIATWGADVYATVQSKTDSVKSTIASGFSNARSTMVNNMQSAMNSIKSQNWYGIGYNICAGIADGLSAGWSWLIDLVCKIVNSLYRAATRALGIHSPSRVFRDGVGLNIGYGIGEGIEASEGSILDSVVGVADAIATEFDAHEYSIGGVVSSTEVSGALTAFSDTITNSFTNLMNRLQAIADGVVFSVPAVVRGSVVPSNVVATTSRDSAEESSRYEKLLATMADLVGSDIASFEAILEKLDEILQAIDEIEIGDTTIGEANQRYVRKMNVIRGVNA